MINNDTEMYSVHKEGKSVVAETFIRTLKSKIYKHMTSIWNNVYIDKLDDIVNEYNNTYHRTFKIKPVDVKDAWTYDINDLNSAEIYGTFYEKELQIPIQQKFRIEKVIKKKGDKLYVKWKGYDSSCNNWIDKKDLIKSSSA